MDGGALARGISGLQHGFGPLLDRIALRLSRPHALAMFLAGLGFLLTVSAVVTPGSLVVEAVSETPEIRLQGDTTVEAAMSDHVSPKSGYAGVGGSATVAPQQFQSLQVREYTLKPGDTLSELAVRFDLNMGTLISFNRISDVRRMEAGDTYRIPNRDGILYTVRRGDSLSEIAARHDTTVNGILDANDLASSTIRVNQTLFVPGAEMDPVEVKLILGELFAYPAQGRYTSGFGMRDDPFTGVRRFHNGIDIANEVGAPVTAAMGGTVAHVGNQLGNYGKFLIMKHPKGYQTLYAHLHSVEVSKGTYLSQGERLGTLGNTGRSTGPHVHFSIIENGSFVDPLDYLR
jgi:murein DD-endopeptidase MepM/ murein hydrolase activator NlpD